MRAKNEMQQAEKIRKMQRDLIKRGMSQGVDGVRMAYIAQYHPASQEEEEELQIRPPQVITESVLPKKSARERFNKSFSHLAERVTPKKFKKMKYNVSATVGGGGGGDELEMNDLSVTNLF